MCDDARNNYDIPHMFKEEMPNRMSCWLSDTWGHGMPTSMPVPIKTFMLMPSYNHAVVIIIEMTDLNGASSCILRHKLSYPANGYNN